jgi:chitinase
VYGREFFVKDLPIDAITDISYAFLKPEADGAVVTGDAWADFDNPFVGGKGVDPQNAWDPPAPAAHLGNLGQFYKLKRAGKKFNLTLAVGGWSWSGRFSEAMATEASRARFVDSLKRVFQRYPGLFAGVSIDHEYLSDDGVNYGAPGNTARPEDGANFVELLKLLRARLPGCRVGMCVSAAPEKIKMPVADIHPLLDHLDIMTYDFMDGAWGNAVAGHHTNLREAPGCPYSVEQAVRAWRARGVPAPKIFIGAAFYSRGFSNTDGMGKPCSGGSADKSWDEGVVDYKALPVAGATEAFDPVAQAAYSYDPARRVLNSYDNPRSVRAKCAFVHEQGLGGIIVWEASGDLPYADPRSLTRVIRDNLTHGTPAAPKPKPKPKPTPKPKPKPGIAGNPGPRGR